MRTSVIATVLNEGPAIERLLESLAGQTRAPDEVVIADGGSSDDTPDRLAAWAESGRLPLRVISVPGANISAGRNAAILETSGDLIAITDAGVRLDCGWLSALVEPFEQRAAPRPQPQAPPSPFRTPLNPVATGWQDERRDRTPAGEPPEPRFVPVVSGWFEADPATPFETALGATTLPHLREIKPDRFLPSSRSVAVRRVAWEAAGGYPEWLDFCEDLVFDLRLRELYGAFAFAPQAVAHFRPRRTLAAFARQYYRYARGDGKADLWRRRHAVRYLTYLVAGPLLLALTLLHSPWWALGLLAGAVIYTATPYRRLIPMLRSCDVWGASQALLLVPIIRVTGDVAKMLGYPSGLVWRWQNRFRPEIHWRRPGWARERG